MYILLNDDKQLIITEHTSIYQNENLIDQIFFYIPSIYKEHDLSDFDITLQYVTPANEVINEKLVKNGLYKDKLEYVLPVDTKISKCAGVVKCSLKIKKETIEKDKKIIYKMNTSEINIDILPSTNYNDFIDKDENGSEGNNEGCSCDGNIVVEF